MGQYWVEVIDDDPDGDGGTTEMLVDTNDPATLVRAYERGQCFALSLALNEATGWPIVAVCGSSPSLVSTMGPRDPDGTIDARAIVSDISDTRDKHYDEQRHVLGDTIMHAMVRMPDGRVLDIRGPVDPIAFLSTDGARSTDCDCTPGCVCVQACCAGTSGHFFVRLDPDHVRELAEEDDFGTRVILWPNMDAARDAAAQVLDAIGWKPARARTIGPRASRPSVTVHEHLR